VILAVLQTFHMALAAARSTTSDANRWSLTLHGNQTRSTLTKPQRYPLRGQPDLSIADGRSRPDGSATFT
jgi:hypothetical protein